MVHTYSYHTRMGGRGWGSRPSALRLSRGRSRQRHRTPPPSKHGTDVQTPVPKTEPSLSRQAQTISLALATQTSEPKRLRRQRSCRPEAGWLPRSLALGLPAAGEYPAVRSQHCRPVPPRSPVPLIRPSAEEWHCTATLGLHANNYNNSDAQDESEHATCKGSQARSVGFRAIRSGCPSP